MPRRGHCFSTLAIALCAAAGSAAAQARVEVPAGCGSESQLHQELEDLVGADVQAALPLRLGIIGPDEDGTYTLALQLSGETRVLRDRDCQALWKSAIVMCAVRVHPELAPAPPAQPAAKPEQPAAAGREDDTPGAWHGGAGLGAGAMLGSTPALAPLVELSGSLESDRFGLALLLRYAAPTEVRTDDGHGARLHAFGGRLALLFAPWRIARFQLGVDVLRLSGTGLGSDSAVSDGAWTLGPVVEAALRPLRLHRVWLELAVAGSLALVRPHFDIVGYGSVYTVRQFGGSGVVRVGWEFL